MLGALSLAFIDSVNLLLIAVIVAVGIVAPRENRRYAKVTGLLIAGDWLGVASLAALMLLIFDGLGDTVQRFVEGPVFGILLIVTGVVTGLLALRGGDNAGLVQKVMGPLAVPSISTVLTGVVLGLVQSATSVPFYGGLALLSAAGIEPVQRYAAIPLYATVALSLPTLCALLVGWVRAKPNSAAGRAFAWARANPKTVSLAATWAVSVMLIALGALHLL
ncbi:MULTISPECIES: hypothetical protein [Corynebacterium]|uniref:Uncharacterized protein n=1 Tax=Corynebacterium riegelii TaxID=156976 RepID=A0A0K1RCC8_9CORY|nr:MULTISPECIES: hypothetical protein [Corynebacterium]AKV59069.1 hypothetical protein AK829_07770 [Corynebacterium riegelii]MDK7179764.1 hypothetical protein [Corynebacterium riegelii]OFT77469.1 hypothetical protein HMPREF3104_01760 [Corynebacterium sp. HMSC30G07]PLA15060.1 hypothetical protein CYJ48_01885 [Corynebacterium riegelii]QQU84897.1 hypothetical protein I6I71_05060 [Corynebacterium riegelii]